MRTLRRLRYYREPLRAARVWRCENRWWSRLLELLAAGGAEFGYHDDFDWGGVRIACAVRHRMNWRPSRYDHQAYETALSEAHCDASTSSRTSKPAAVRSLPSAGALVPESGTHVVLLTRTTRKGACGSGHQCQRGSLASVPPHTAG